MHDVTFFPLGNADCCRINTANGKKFLFDFGNQGNPDDPQDKRIDLAAELRAELDATKRTGYDVVAITHLDDDHVCGAPDFFYFEYAAKYQSKDRATIGEMWVPAAVIVEDRPDGDAGAVQAEARYRLINRKGIKVFSRPDRLREWMAKRNLNVADYADFIVDAGRTVPNFNLQNDGIEFFVHSPFAEHCDGQVIDRNDASLVLQVRMIEGQAQTDLILCADITHEIWSGIVNVTRYHQREDRLRWNLFKLSHHCSFHSIGSEKGRDRTSPNAEVKWLFEEQSQEGCQIISTSNPISREDTIQPPHFQAANYYKGVIADRGGDFLVTMSEPNSDKPEPIVFKIGMAGASRSHEAGIARPGLLSAIATARGTNAPPAQRVGFGRND